MGDIEKFFNENFFKKVSPGEQSVKRLKEEPDLFMGSPETDYEPAYPQTLNTIQVIMQDFNDFKR
jgi:hypothetical protein